VIHRSPLPDVVIPDTALTPFVLARGAATPDRPALVDGPSGRTLTFAELQGAIASLAGGVQARGVGPGDVLAIMAPNLPEYAVVFHAVATAGGSVTTINPTYTAEEVHHQLVDSGATRLVTVGPFLETARAGAEGTAVGEIAVIGDGGGGAAPLAEWFGEPIGQQPVDPAEHVVALPYSSGTTGLAKGVMLTHRNLVANIAQIEPMLDVGDDESALAFLPFFHIYGMQVLMNTMLFAGATVVTMPRFDLEQALTLIQERRITRFYIVPPVALALAKHPLVDQFDLSSLRQVLSGAAPLGGDLAVQAAERIGCDVVQGYGMTELSPVSHATRAGDFKPGSIGTLVPNAEARIVDASGTDVDGGEGELWIRGPLVMKGYLNKPDATAATIDDDGWLHTGDVATIDADEHYFIVDRVKELIKYKGFQVPPAELEALIVTHPAVADVAVIGVPDDEAGEIPKAFVVCKPGESVTEAQIQEFVGQHVAHYKQVRLVEFVDEIPKSASGKILRRMLRDRP